MYADPVGQALAWANRVVGLVMTQTAIIGSGPISNPIREAFYTAD